MTGDVAMCHVCRVTAPAARRALRAAAEPPPPREEVWPRWTLADRLRKIRREVVGGSQAEMAALLGWPLGAYSNWEAGKAKPRELIAVATQIERVTGVPAEWVVGLRESPEPTTPSGRSPYGINDP